MLEGWRRAALLLAGLSLLAPGEATAAVNGEDSCWGFFYCANECAADDLACGQGCLPSGGNDQALLQSLNDCLQTNCPVADGEQLSQCLETFCGSQLAACYNAGRATGDTCDEGLTEQGECHGNRLAWCFQGAEFERDCEQLGTSCETDQTGTSSCPIALQPGPGAAPEEPDDRHLLGLAGLASCGTVGGGAPGLLAAAFLGLWLLAARRRPGRG
jgi:uncharacterized protein (TIGR03382 family)